ncbi:hypothetical protein ACIBSV_02550 [Embleya sp. NPDC050154]|uniref:hypothetical protein n=1 Tax=Embleya sp. NPDC050154 TaxID=3363988 RepID=UPI0037A4A055
MTDEKPAPKSRAKARKAPAVQSSVLAAALQDAMNGSFLNSGTDSTAALLAQMGGGSGTSGGTTSGPPFKNAATAVPAPEPEPAHAPEPEPVHAAAAPAVEEAPAPAAAREEAPRASESTVSPAQEPVAVAAAAAESVSAPEPEPVAAEPVTAEPSSEPATAAATPNPRPEATPEPEPAPTPAPRLEAARPEPEPAPHPTAQPAPMPTSQSEPEPARAPDPAPVAETTPRTAEPVRTPAPQPAKASAPAKAPAARAPRRSAPAPAPAAPSTVGSGAGGQSAHASLLDSFLDARINSKGWETWGFRLLPDVKARLGKRLTADKRSSQNRRLALGHYLNAALLELPDDNDEQIEMIRSFLRARGGITDPSQSSSYRVSPAVYELARDLDTELTATEKRGLVVYLFSAAVELFLERLDAEGALGRPEIFSPQQ